MKTTIPLAAALAAVCLSSFGCSTGENRELKRSADRAQLRLTRAEAEGAQLKLDVESLRSQLAEAGQRVEQLQQELSASRTEVSRAEQEIASLRRRIAAMEASSNQVGMPTSRPAQP